MEVEVSLNESETQSGSFVCQKFANDFEIQIFQTHALYGKCSSVAYRIFYLRVQNSIR